MKVSCKRIAEKNPKETAAQDFPKAFDDFTRFFFFFWEFLGIAEWIYKKLQKFLLQGDFIEIIEIFLKEIAGAIAYETKGNIPKNYCANVEGIFLEILEEIFKKKIKEQ